MNNIDRKASAISGNAVDVFKIQKGDVGELLKLAFQLDPKAVEESFARAGVKVQNYKDIALMSRLHSTGGDELGFLINSNGNKIIFSVKKTLEKVKSDFTSSFKHKRLNLKWK